MHHPIRLASIRTQLKRLMICLALAAFVILAANITSAYADTPLWSYKGAKWYSMTDTGNAVVGLSNGISMLDGATGKELWKRTDVG